MNLAQVWFTEEINPVFTDQNKEDYSKIVKNQVLTVGKEYLGRRLVRALIESSRIEELKTFLNNLGKAVKICDARNYNGVRYGYKEVLAYDSNGVRSSSIVAVQGLTPYAIDDAEYNLHMTTINYTDSIGNTVSIQPRDNSALGFANWGERI